MFLFIDSDLKIDAPQLVIEIDRDKAAQLGLSMTQVGSALGGLLGGAYTNYFSLGIAILQGDLAGAATLAADDRPGDAVPDRDGQRHADPGLGDRHACGRRRCRRRSRISSS